MPKLDNPVGGLSELQGAISKLLANEKKVSNIYFVLLACQTFQGLAIFKTIFREMF